MKRILITLAILVGSLTSIGPATADDNFPPCPTRATEQSVTEGCKLPSYPEAAQPVVTYLTSAFYLLDDYLTQQSYKVSVQQETISAQQDKISHQRKVIKRLRAKLAHR